MEKTFLLGVGAQKAGTSWIYSYVSKSPGARFGSGKEWHVWDTLTIPQLSHFNKWNWRELPLWKALLMAPHLSQRMRFLRKPDLYFDYFARLLNAHGVALTGDVTPSYATLDTETLRQVRDEFQSRGIAVKTLFVMRDPVERCWSHLKMLVKNGKVDRLFEPIHDIHAQFPAFCRSQEAMLRTNYPVTIERLRQVFPEQDIHFGFYETMFQPEEIERLSAFLGIPPQPEMGNVRVHGGASRSLPKGARVAARSVLEPVYAQTQALFPQTRDFWTAAATSPRPANLAS
jgi:hypothetical protein